MIKNKMKPMEVANIKEKSPKTSKTSNTSQGIKCQKHGTMPADSEKPNTKVCRKATPLEDWWDSADLKNRFNFSERTLCTMREKGLLPYTIVAGRCFYRAEDIRNLFDESFYRLNPELAKQEAQAVNGSIQSKSSCYSKNTNCSNQSINIKK